MEIFLSLLIGLGLSAACGFRIFVPMLIASIALRTGHLHVGEGFAWLGSDAALIALGAATLLEIAAYYIPCVDHFLDLIGAPAAIVAGALLTASFITDISPWLQWSLATVVGGGSAAAVHAGMATARGFVTATTAGLGNGVVSTGEAVAAAGTSFLTIIAPPLGCLLALLILFFLCRLAIRFYKKTRRGKMYAAAIE